MPSMMKALLVFLGLQAYLVSAVRISMENKKADIALAVYEADIADKAPKLENESEVSKGKKKFGLKSLLKKFSLKKKSKAMDAAEVVEDLVENVEDKVENAVDQAQKVVQDVVDENSVVVEDVVEHVVDQASKVVEGNADAVQLAIEDVKDQANKVVENVDMDKLIAGLNSQVQERLHDMKDYGQSTIRDMVADFKAEHEDFDFSKDHLKQFAEMQVNTYAKKAEAAVEEFKKNLASIDAQAWFQNMNANDQHAAKKAALKQHGLKERSNWFSWFKGPDDAAEEANDEDSQGEGGAAKSELKEVQEHDQE